MLSGHIIQFRIPALSVDLLQGLAAVGERQRVSSNHSDWEQVVRKQIQEAIPVFSKYLHPLLDASNETFVKYWETSTGTDSSALKKLRPYWRFLARSTTKATPRGAYASIAVTTATESETNILLDSSSFHASYSVNWHIAYRLSNALDVAVRYAWSPSLCLNGGVASFYAYSERGDIQFRSTYLSGDLASLIVASVGRVGNAAASPQELFPHLPNAAVLASRLCSAGFLIANSSIPFACDRPFSHLAASVGSISPLLSALSDTETDEFKTLPPATQRHKCRQAAREGNESVEQPKLPENRLVVTESTALLHGTFSCSALEHIRSELFRYNRIAHVLISNSLHGAQEIPTQLHSEIKRRHGVGLVPIQLIHGAIRDDHAYRDVVGIADGAPGSARRSFVDLWSNEATTDVHNVELGQIDGPRLPEHYGFEAAIRVSASSGELLDRGEFLLWVENMGFPGSLMSRFSRSTDRYSDAIRAYGERIQSAYPGAIVADIAVDARGSSFNLSRRPLVLDAYVEAFACCAPAERSARYSLKQIAVRVSENESHLCVVENRNIRRLFIVCRSTLFPKEDVFFHVLMILGSPHQEPLPISHRVSNAFQTSMGFNRRIRAGRLLLCPAMWRFAANDLAKEVCFTLARSSRNTRLARSATHLMWATEFASRCHLPRLMFYRVGLEPPQLIDWQCCFSVDTLVASIRKHHGDIVFEEMFPSTDGLWLKDDSGQRRVAEIALIG